MSGRASRQSLRERLNTFRLWCPNHTREDLWKLRKIRRDVTRQYDVQSTVAYMRFLTTVHGDDVPGVERIVLPVHDGNRPPELTDAAIAEADTWEPEYRLRCRMPDQRALVWRECIYDRGRGDGYAASVRETHPAVHKALVGKSPDECRWCKGNGA